MRGRIMAAVFLLLLAGGSWSAAQDSKSSADSVPTVETTADGQHVLHLTSRQQAAVDSFLKSDRDLIPTSCNTLGISPEECKTEYNDWAALAPKGVPLQFPYATWGDFNHDGALDLVMPFFGRTKVNNYGWRRWAVVVFQGIRSGEYKPVVVVKGTWGVCFDGMVYRPDRKDVEFWCGSMGGNVQWNGSAFVGKLLKGD